MNHLVEELRTLNEELRSTTLYANDLAYTLTLGSLLKNAKNIGKSWCGSWYGYQARVYYRNFDTPPVGKHFDRRYGLEVYIYGESRDRSSWSEYSNEQVMRVIKKGIDDKDIRNISNHTKEWIHKFMDKKEDLLNVIRIAQQTNNSSFRDMFERAENLEIQTVDEIVASDRPTEMNTNDPIAKQQGFQTPPHIQVKAEALWSIRAKESIDKLCDLVGKTIAQIERVHATEATHQMDREMIFIGHGRALDYLLLEKFLKERLHLRVEEYNRVATGGMSRKERLEAMLDSSCFAFIVMTAEDELAIETSTDENEKTRMQARMNVIHEAGLFQGRLGFEHAIILLENGCEEFSNIHGVDQIRFDKHKLDSTFDEIRRHLEERGVIPKPAYNLR